MDSGSQCTHEGLAHFTPGKIVKVGSPSFLVKYSDPRRGGKPKFRYELVGSWETELEARNSQNFEDDCLCKDKLIRDCTLDSPRDFHSTRWSDWESQKFAYPAQNR